MSVWAGRAVSLFLLVMAGVPGAGGAQAPTRGAVDAAAGSQASLADAPGVEVARAYCVSCHGATLIAGQRLTRAAWDREVAKMERWSRAVPSPDRDRLLDYLSGRFGVAVAESAAAPSARGRAVHDRACLTCHDAAFTRAQRLTAAGWRRTVAKMVQWGAPVPAEDVDALVAYLSTAPAEVNFP